MAPAEFLYNVGTLGTLSRTRPSQYEDNLQIGHFASNFLVNDWNHPPQWARTFGMSGILTHTMAKKLAKFSKVDLDQLSFFLVNSSRKMRSCRAWGWRQNLGHMLLPPAPQDAPAACKILAHECLAIRKLIDHDYPTRRALEEGDPSVYTGAAGIAYMYWRLATMDSHYIPGQRAELLERATHYSSASLRLVRPERQGKKRVSTFLTGAAGVRAAIADSKLQLFHYAFACQLIISFSWPRWCLVRFTVSLLQSRTPRMTLAPLQRIAEQFSIWPRLV
jgi:hypothetical protein